MGMTACLAPITASQFGALLEAPDTISALVYPADRLERKGRLDLDKSWHGLHWLLTGDVWGGAFPLGAAILRGEDVGPDLGMGPARFVTPEEVVRVAAALEAISEEELTRRYDPVTMTALKIYPAIWEDEGSGALVDYLLPYFRQLVRFYADAAQRGDAVLQWIA